MGRGWIILLDEVQYLSEADLSVLIVSIHRMSQAARVVVSSLEGALMMERLLDGSAGFEVTLKAIRISLSPAT